MDTNLVDYYEQRAPHYDDIYRRPERQAELNDIADLLQQLTFDKNVLEVACGTGYWTERYAELAQSVLATDVSPTMLAQAKARPALKTKVAFQLVDAFGLTAGKFDVCVAGFWWSHVKRSEQDAFLGTMQKACGSGAVLVLFDNCYVEGDSTPLARTDAEGNTYQIRRLPDGSRHEVIKNFPTDSAIRKRFANHARDIRIARHTHFWTMTCVLR